MTNSSKAEELACPGCGRAMLPTELVLGLDQHGESLGLFGNLVLLLLGLSWFVVVDAAGRIAALGVSFSSSTNLTRVGFFDCSSGHEELVGSGLVCS